MVVWMNLWSQTWYPCSLAGTQKMMIGETQVRPVPHADSWEGDSSAPDLKMTFSAPFFNKQIWHFHTDFCWVKKALRHGNQALSCLTICFKKTSGAEDMPKGSLLMLWEKLILLLEAPGKILRWHPIYWRILLLVTVQMSLLFRARDIWFSFSFVTSTQILTLFPSFRIATIHVHHSVDSHTEVIIPKYSILLTLIM